MRIDKMSERIGKEIIDRAEGYLYYLGKDGYVWRVPMKGVKGRKARVGDEHIEREKGYFYFVEFVNDYAGYVCRIKMVR